MVALVREEKARYSKKLLDVRNDLVFKIIFGEERNQDLLLMLLNAILTEEVVEITFLDTHIGAEFVDEKYSVMDIRVRTKDQMEINIEMQIENHDGFEQRMLLYWAKLYTKQLKGGAPYTQLKKAVQISIVDFNFLKNDHFHSMFHLLEKEKQFSFTDHCEIHVLELPKVGLIEDRDRQEILTKWMLFLVGDDKTKEALAMTDMGIEKAYDELQRVSEDEVMRERAIARDKFLSDQATRKELAELKGRNEGREEGRSEAILAMYSKGGLSVEQIASILELAVDEVNVVINQVQ